MKGKNRPDLFVSAEDAALFFELMAKHCRSGGHLKYKASLKLTSLRVTQDFVASGDQVFTCNPETIDAAKLAIAKAVQP